jgi:hypothetical protein
MTRKHSRQFRKQRSDRGVPKNVADTGAMRLALVRLRRLIESQHTGNSRNRSGISVSSVSRKLRVAPRTLRRWLAIKMWPPGNRLVDILSIIVELESVRSGHAAEITPPELDRDLDNDPFSSMLISTAYAQKILRWSIDTSGRMPYNSVMPAMEPPPAGWLVDAAQ